VFVGGGYMRQRVTEVSRDSGGRQEHWSQSLRMLNGADWLFGQGLGRFAANRALSGRVDDQTGDYRLQGSAASGQYLALSSGKHAMGSGEYLRVSQRIVLPAAGPVRLQLRLRSSAPVQLWAEVCEKHLLYSGECAAAQLPVAKAEQWQTVDMKLLDPSGGHRLQTGPWWAPRQIVFSVALAESGQRAELDNLVLTDASGTSLLSNGDFERGLSRWFFSSDKNHLPWHAKNLQLHLLMEQGLVGLLAFSLAALVGLWRVSFGGARAHPLAPLLAAGLVAVLVVGAIDSLMDMPRIAFLVLLLMALALALPSPSDFLPRVRRSRRGRGRSKRRRSSSSGSSSGTGSSRSSSRSASPSQRHSGRSDRAQRNQRDSPDSGAKT
jgi:hypothetical protein